MENLGSRDVEAKKTIRLFVLLNAMMTLSRSFFIAIFFILPKERGLSIPEISAIVFVLMIAVFIFEIPTGVIADVFGRKLSYVFSRFFLALSLIVYVTADSFSLFLIAMILQAISLTLSSGAFQAWLVDSLKHNFCFTPLSSILVRTKQIEFGAGIAGVLIGSFLADKNIAFPWIASIFVTFATGIIAIVFMKEEYFSEQKKEFSFVTKIKSTKKTVRIGIECAKSSKAVKFVLLVGLLQLFVTQPVSVQYQIFFEQFLFNKTALGFLWIAITIAMTIGTTLAPRLLSKLKNNHKKALALSQIGIGIGILFSGIFVFPFSLLAFLFWNLMTGMFDPISDEYLNKNIPSKSRATILSFESMACSVGSGIGLIVGGFIAEYYSIPVAWKILGILLIVSTLLIMKNGNNKIKNEAT